MATLADLLALQPATLPRYEGTLAEALLGGRSGKGQALPPEFSDWAPPMPGKRGMTDMLAAMLPLEQNSAGERRLGIPGAVQALPEMPKAIADMIRRGVTGDYQPTTEDPMTGRMYDPRQYEDAFNLAGLAATGGAPMPSPNNSLAAFSVWHGTPHKFPAERLIEKADGTRTHILAADPLPEGAKVLEELPLGRFRMDKIGTGEGAQAFGHGLYTAEAKGTAADYRNKLANARIIDGRGVPINGREYEITDEIEKALIAKGMPASEAADRATGWGMAVLQGDLGRLDPVARAIVEKRGLHVPSGGSLYKVEIDAEPEQFLDWDRKLAEQPEVAKKLGFSLRSGDEIHTEAEALFQKYGQYPDMPREIQQRLQALQDELDKRVPNLTGQQYYSGRSEDDYLHSTLAGERFTPEHSAPLREKGIPGIRYLDGGSRTATPPKIVEGPTGFSVYWGNDPKPVDIFPTRQQAEAAAREIDGRSRNYVLFDDSLMKILLRE